MLEFFSKPSLDPERKIDLIEKIKEYFSEELDVDIGDLKAEFILDFFQENCGKEFYNKGINDARSFLSKKMEDIEIDMDQIIIR